MAHLCTTKLRLSHRHPHSDNRAVPARTDKGPRGAAGRPRTGDQASSIPRRPFSYPKRRCNHHKRPQGRQPPPRPWGSGIHLLPRRCTPTKGQTRRETPPISYGCPSSDPLEHHPAGRRGSSCPALEPGRIEPGMRPLTRLRTAAGGHGDHPSGRNGSNVPPRLPSSASMIPRAASGEEESQEESRPTCRTRARDTSRTSAGPSRGGL